MKPLVIIVCLCALFLITASISIQPFFSNSLDVNFPRPESGEFYMPLAGSLKGKITSKLEKKYNMKSAGGGSSLMGNVHSLSVFFKTKGPLSQEECRILLVNCIEDFLKDINENKEIRPYLSDYPFQPRNLQLSIGIYDQNFNHLSESDISSIGEIYGNVFYKKCNPETPFDAVRIEESYEEAKKIVLGESHDR